MNLRSWKMATLVGAGTVVSGFGLAAPGAAHPHPEQKTERVIIFTDRHDGPAAKDGAHRIRTFHIDGARGLVDCDGERSEVSEETAKAEGEREKTRIVICGKGANSAEHRERLEKALSRIQSNEHLSAEHRERVAAALREAIDRIRTER